jgi:hypothetical protein
MRACRRRRKQKCQKKSNEIHSDYQAGIEPFVADAHPIYLSTGIAVVSVLWTCGTQANTIYAQD